MMIMMSSLLQELAKIHQLLHRDLNDAQNGTSEKTISEVFLEHQERLIVYGEYCANLVTARQELEDVMSNNEEARSIIQVGFRLWVSQVLWVWFSSQELFLCYSSFC